MKVSKVQYLAYVATSKRPVYAYIQSDIRTKSSWNSNTICIRHTWISQLFAAAWCFQLHICINLSFSQILRKVSWTPQGTTWACLSSFKVLMPSSCHTVLLHFVQSRKWYHQMTGYIVKCWTRPFVSCLYCTGHYSVFIYLLNILYVCSK